MNRFVGPVSDVASAIFIWLAAGLIFFTQEILKYIAIERAENKS